MCVHSFFSFIDFFCPTHEPNLGFGCEHLSIYIFFLCIQKQLSISPDPHISSKPTCAYGSICDDVVSLFFLCFLVLQLFIEQVPVPAGHTALLATAATANQKALLPGQSLMEQAWRDLLSLWLGDPGCPMQCLLCLSLQWP